MQVHGAHLGDGAMQQIDGARLGNIFTTVSAALGCA